MPVRLVVTAGTAADREHAVALIEGFGAKSLLADRAHGADEIVSYALEHGTDPVISPKRNRKNQRRYDAHLCKSRHLVENAFREIKKWRGQSSRYAKTSASLEAAIRIRFIHLWSTVLI